MRRIDYKKILSVALLTASFLFLAPQSPADARGIFTPFIEAAKKVVSQQKPASEPQVVVWNYNGTTDGVCNNIGEFDDTDPAPGMQEWLFILTSPAKDGEYSLTYTFEGHEEVTEDEPFKEVGSIHFIVESPIGAVLEKASATDGTSRSVLTVSHCEINVLPLEIEKTADTTFTRSWTWDIEKTADQTDLGILEPEDVRTVEYEVTVSADSDDSGHEVSGTITIENPAENPTATIESISDEMSLFGLVDVDCEDTEGDVEFPYELLSGETLECTYSQEIVGAVDQENIVTVVTSGVVPGGTAEANVIFSEDPTEEVDECINLSDTNSVGPQDLEICNDDLDELGEYTATYDLTFSKDGEADVLLECGLNEYPNIASFVTNNTGTEDDATATVMATVECPVALLWCSPGFWGNGANFDIYEYINDNIVADSPESISSGDAYSSIPEDMRAELKDGSPADPTIDEVLNNPNTFGGPAMNSVADYFAYLLGWNGTQEIHEEEGLACPLNAHGELEE